MTTVKEQCDKVLSQPAIDVAAKCVSDQLADRGFAEVILQPGDATAYRFIIAPPGRSVDSVFSDEDASNIVAQQRTARHYMVALVASFGRAYEWAGQSMHGDYCADKWAIDGRPWTGEVVARFLTALSALVPSVGE